MPSVRDKASQFSLHRHQNRLYSALSKTTRNPKSFGKWFTKAPRRFDILLKNRRLGCPDSDMPRVGEEQVFVTKEIASPRSPNRKLIRNSIERTPTRDPARPQLNGDAEERGQDRPGSSASSKSGQANRLSRATKSSSTPLNVSQSSNEGGRAAATNKSDVKLSATSAASLDHHIDKQLRHRKRRIVESLMDTIVECIEKKLDTLEDGCEGGKTPSQASSSAFRSGNRPSQAAGQKRHHRREEGDEDNSNDDDDNGSRKNHSKKKTKKICDDTRQKFACPYYKHDPQKFKNHRTCLGPGWTEVHRVKEHLKRSHMLSQHKCYRCLRHFNEEEQLKAHQRKDKPCPLTDPKTVRRDLTAGFEAKKWEQLQKRLKKTSEEKWKEWYCILFDIDPSSSDIPTPYHDIPVQSGRTSVSDTCGLRDFYMERIVPMIRRHVDQEVERAILAVEDDIKANVKDVIKDLPRRIMDSIPPPAQFSDDMNFDGLTALDDLEFDDEDCFNFGQLSGDYDPLAGSDSTSSTAWSDPTIPSSSTSIEDETPPSFCLDVRDHDYRASMVGYNHI